MPEVLAGTDTVLVNCFSFENDYLAVVPDEEQGGRSATSALLDAGHTRIAFVNTTTPSPAQTGRLAGYQTALEAAGVTYDPSLVFEVSPEQEGGIAASASVLESGATAVFCHNDRVAMGLYDGLREAGTRIPEDIAVVGFDNQDVIAAHLRPPLSTDVQPHYELGAAGVRALLGLESGDVAAPTLVACPPVARASV